ncbi:Na+/H+ antiporter NhaC family protein [Thalassotalea sp. ND16A]|uniref:Na+/H+ antiporter NhaC family protein n=1 Tax=Thalassotalea sp. ND16A TaxID=1535422 RepID=UPI00051A2BC4|nr:Na+/H+ antiporter NhaC family protein [Thalassotalea sp. ND16A]KGJ87864.1 hypothetical protein ND16A_2778 [Thalassotalea sp. ND16A]
MKQVQIEKQERLLKYFYFSRWMAVLPLLFMIVPVIVMSFKGVLSQDIMIAGGVIGLLIGSLFARQKKEYWDVVIRSLCDPTGLLVFGLFLIVGIYGKLLTAAHLAEGIIWLSSLIDVGPALFALFIYVVCSVLGTAMGTSLGIVVIMTPVLFPAAVAVGVHPVLAAGAILSGAATGDHFAPVSDTTIISSSTQRYKFKTGSAGIGEVVRARMIYTIPAFAVACLLYLFAGGLTAQAPIQDVAGIMGDANPLGLIMIIPMFIVVITAIYGRTVFEALTYGILAGLLIGIVSGLITLEQLVYIENTNVKGIIVEGATSNLDTIVMIVLMMGAYGVLREYGLLDSLISSLKGSWGNTPRNTELTMFGIGWLLNFLLIGLVARITVVAGPIFNELGQSHNIHPTRRANILDGVANSFSFVVPWHIWPLIMIMTINPLVEIYPYLSVPAPIDFFTATFYPLVIWLVMLISIISGFGRKFEKEAN